MVLTIQILVSDQVKNYNVHRSLQKVNNFDNPTNSWGKSVSSTNNPTDSWGKHVSSTNNPTNSWGKCMSSTNNCTNTWGKCVSSTNNCTKTWGKCVSSGRSSSSGKNYSKSKCPACLTKPGVKFGDKCVFKFSFELQKDKVSDLCIDHWNEVCKKMLKDQDTGAVTVTRESLD